MLFYRGRLPHWIPDHAIVFVTWRLAENTGRTGFRQRAEQLDRLHSGSVWWLEPRIASVVNNALRYGKTVRQFYALHAWVIMPNHIHVILEPRIALPDILRSLKGRTSRVANRILGRTGKPFWQDKSFDHWIPPAEGRRQKTIVCPTVTSRKMYKLQGRAVKRPAR